MKNKKNIDRLFQEKFQNFETAPNEQTWINIQNALQEKKKEKRIIPIWFKYVGIAAVLTLSFFASNNYFKMSIKPQKTIVIDPEIVTIPKHNNNSISTKTEKGFQKSFQKTESSITFSVDEQNQLTQKETDKSPTNKESKININTTINKNNTAITPKEQQSPQNESKLLNHQVKSNAALAENYQLKKAKVTETITNQYSNEAVVKEKTTLAQIDADKKQSTPLFALNELEKIAKEKEDKKEPEDISSRKNKWEITPNVATMYINTNSKGSSLDPKLSENKKTPDNGLSIGIGITYALNNKIALRTGINAFSVGYNTNDVNYAIGLNTNSLASVTYTTNQSIEIENPSTYNTFTSSEKELRKTSAGSINQRMGYYEIPFELSYAVLNKKLGVTIIGGISTLFLKENEISILSTESNFKLGEANNLKPIHFSTNFGLGFKYEFVKSFHLNFEPMIKYQLNNYSKEASNHSLIILGLYTGISYRF